MEKVVYRCFVFTALEESGPAAEIYYHKEIPCPPFAPKEGNAIIIDGDWFFIHEVSINVDKRRVEICGREEVADAKAYGASLEKCGWKEGEPPDEEVEDGC